MTAAENWRFFAWGRDAFTGLAVRNGPYTRATKKAAINDADRVWRGYFIALENSKTGEKWERIKGSWFQISPAVRRAKAAAAQVGGSPDSD